MLAKLQSQKTDREQLWAFVSQQLIATFPLLIPTHQPCKAVEVQSMSQWHKPLLLGTKYGVELDL